MFQDSLVFKDKEIPRIILGTAPFTAESYFGHRSRLYHLDLQVNHQNVAKIIKKSANLGIKAIDLKNDNNLIKAYEEAILSQEVDMKVIGTIGKTNIDYVNPDFEKAKEANWKEDIKILKQYNTPLMLIDEFITDSYDWDLLEEILSEIRKSGALAGLITSYPFKTTPKLIDSPIIDMFDFYMIPINKLGYMMDTQSFMEEERKELASILEKINKKIIVNKILACGIQIPEEAFNFLKTLDCVDMVSIGVASEKEAETDFNLLKYI